MKICRICNTEKPEKQFVSNKAFKGGKDTICLECSRNKVKEWRKQNPHIPHGKRKSISSGYRDIIISFLIERDGFVCGMCGESLEDSKIHIDHIIPVALGGVDVMSNVRLTHATCNMDQALSIRKEKQLIELQYHQLQEQLKLMGKMEEQNLPGAIKKQVNNFV